MLHHIEINVLDLKRTRVFYDFLLPLLGYELYQDWEQGFSYRDENDGHYLVFVQTQTQHLEPCFHRQKSGLNHLAFVIPTKTEVETIRMQLLERGVSELYESRFPYAGGPEHFAFFFEDPDRLKLEIVAK